MTNTALWMTQVLQGTVMGPPSVAGHELSYAYTLVDPSGELPEDAIAFSFQADGVHVHDGLTREHVNIVWPWHALRSIEGVRDSEDPEDMELVFLTVKEVGDIQLECNNAAQMAGLFNGGKSRHLTTKDRAASDPYEDKVAGKSVATAGTAAAQQQQQRWDAGKESAAAAYDEENRPSASSGGAKLKRDSVSCIPNLGICASLSLVFVFMGITYGVYGHALDEHVSVDGGGSMEVEDGVASRRWTVVDAIYFTITTVTTVGYGDLSPKTRSGQLFTSFFVFLAVFGVGMALGEVAHFLVDRAEQKKEQALQRLAAETGVAKTMSGKTILKRRHSPSSLMQMRSARKRAAQFARRTKRLRTCLALTKKDMIQYTKYAQALVPVGVALLLGQGLCPIEGWDPALALYISCVTLTTVGFGDFSPATQGGRGYCIFFIPVGVSLVLGAMSKIVEIRMLAKSKKCTSIKEILQMDASGDGEVNLQEFQLFMLKNMGKISTADLSMLRHQFEILDKSGDGTLSAADIDDETEQAAMGAFGGGSKKIQV